MSDEDQEKETYELHKMEFVALVVKDKTGCLYEVRAPRKGTHLHGPEQVASYWHARMKKKCDPTKEHFCAMYLDARRKVLDVRIIGVGTLTASLVHPRELFKPAVELSAAAIVCFHNHPSGSAEPSDEDLALSRRLVRAGQIMGIEVMDHVVIGDVDYTSIRERGEMTVPKGNY